MRDPAELSFPFPPGTAFDPTMFARVMNGRGHGGFLGLRYQAHGDDWIEIALPWREDLVGVPETGVLASGPIITLLDNATSMSVWVKSGRFRPQATLDLRLDYVRAATPGATIVARAECYRLTRSAAFVRGLAHDGDIADPVAHAAGVFMAVEPS
jgi:uncharacterized protein (TIGR00369 family)